MKKLGLSIILACYTLTRWIADHYDSDTFYYIADGVTIGLVGFFLYLNSGRDSVSKLSLTLVLLLALSQVISETNAYYYNEYIRFLPAILLGVTALEIYKHRTDIPNGFKWVLNRLKK